MIYDRRTVAHPCEFVGPGLHSGDPVRVVVHPAEDGIHFRTGSDRIPARPESVADTTRSTSLATVRTIEHLMSAFAGLAITDAEVEVEGGEIPGVDGSALPFVDAFFAVGFASLGTREMPALFKRIFVQEEATKVAVGSGHGHWRYEYNTDERWPGEQVFESELGDATYRAEIAPARTFALAEEVPKLIELGLGKGLDERSALILGIEGYKNPARFESEPARHKLLDLMGDLYLSGIPCAFLNVVAERSGHRVNVHTAHLLRQATLA